MKRKSRLPLRKTAAKYRRARKSLREPISKRSRLGLDWTNFFISDVQTSFGSFVAFYLAGLNWSKPDVGLVLTIGGLAAVISLVPGGALADEIARKRLLVACGIISLAGAALIYAFVPTFQMVVLAELLHGITAGLIGPGISAISLGLVGRRAMSSRTGRNQRFQAAGTAITAGLMGFIGATFSTRAIFFATAGFCMPALLALNLIQPKEIDYHRARNAKTGDKSRERSRLIDLAKNPPLLAFAACLMLLQLADASMLPIIGENLALGGGRLSSLYMSGLVVVPQLVVAALAPWAGYHSEKRGRKPLLLLAFGMEALRALLLALFSLYPILILVQVLNGVSGAIITVLTILVITDLTTGSGRFNLTVGLIGMLQATAAAISTTMSGFLFAKFGTSIGFLGITGVAVAATLLLWISVPETKPSNYLD
ncbi:MAG: MFS transporter [Hyphomicrobiales bacterium]|nr:MFS transporter [Hyphomicrobiales bacterium]